jgi:MarR family transcriptional regulator, organic hydroperoxide resistance regulator
MHSREETAESMETTDRAEHVDKHVDDWELLAQVAQAYRSLSDSFMDRIGMHRAQATLLCRLFDKDGMTQSEIAEQLAVQGATVTNMLQRMEEAGLVVRRRDPEDNRLVRVYLTDTGREQEHAITEQFMKVEAAIFEGLGQQERSTLRGMLNKMLRNMNDES